MISGPQSESYYSGDLCSTKFGRKRPIPRGLSPKNLTNPPHTGPPRRRIILKPAQDLHQYKSFLEGRIRKSFSDRSVACHQSGLTSALSDQRRADWRNWAAIGNKNSVAVAFATSKGRRSVITGGKKAGLAENSEKIIATIARENDSGVPAYIWKDQLTPGWASETQLKYIIKSTTTGDEAVDSGLAYCVNGENPTTASTASPGVNSSNNCTSSNCARRTHRDSGKLSQIQRLCKPGIDLDAISRAPSENKPENEHSADLLVPGLSCSANGDFVVCNHSRCSMSISSTATRAPDVLKSKDRPTLCIPSETKNCTGNKDLTNLSEIGGNNLLNNNSERNAYCPTRRPVPPDFLDFYKNSKFAKHSNSVLDSELDNLLPLLESNSKHYGLSKSSPFSAREETTVVRSESQKSGSLPEQSGARYLLPATAQSRKPILVLQDDAEEMESQNDLWLRLNSLLGGYSNLSGESELPQLNDTACTLTAARYRGSVAGRAVNAESAARLADHNFVSSPVWEHQEGNAQVLNKQTTLYPDRREAVTGRHSSVLEAEKNHFEDSERRRFSNQEESPSSRSPTPQRPIYSSQDTETVFPDTQSKHWHSLRRHPWTENEEKSRRNEARWEASPLPQPSSTGVENSSSRPTNLKLNPTLAADDIMQTLLEVPLSNGGGRSRNGSVLDTGFRWSRARRENIPERIPLIDPELNDLANMNRTFGGEPLRVDGGQRKNNAELSNEDVPTGSNEKPYLFKQAATNNNRNSALRHSTGLKNLNNNGSQQRQNALNSATRKGINYRKRQSLISALGNSNNFEFPPKKENVRHSCCSPEDLKLCSDDSEEFCSHPQSSESARSSRIFDRNSLKSKSLYVSQPSLSKASDSISLNFGVTNPELLRFGHGNCLDKIAHLKKTRKKPLEKVYQFFSPPSAVISPASQQCGNNNNNNNFAASKSAPPWSARFSDIWRIFGGTGGNGTDDKLLRRSVTLGSLIQPSREDLSRIGLDRDRDRDLEDMIEETETIKSQESSESSRSFGQFTRVKSLPATPVRKKLSAQSEDSHVVVERIYCVRQVLHKVSEEYYSYNNGELRHAGDLDLNQGSQCAAGFQRSSGRSKTSSYHSTTDSSSAETPTPVVTRQSGSEENADQPLELPQRLMRRKSQRSKASMRRSRSQPMHSPLSDEDNEHRSGFTITIPSRNGDSGIISATSSEDAGDQGSDESGRSPRENPCVPSLSFRSSTYSTTSSVTTSSVGSSENNQERSSWDSDTVILAEALWDHVTMQPEELQFSVGDVIQVSDWSFSDFWFGTSKDKSGWFPASHVRLLANQNLEDVNLPSCETAETEPDENNLHRQRMLRRSVLQELITTERDYFSLLRNLVEGFLYQARRRTEMFPAERLLLIFGNLEQIYELHRKFLNDLEKSVDMTEPDISRVGNCFLQHEKEFEIYSEYCNNHALSCSELASLYQKASYRQFFEACRLLRGMPELSLDAFLLTPVQRICKYPLQLAELVKSTRPSHPDFSACREALIAMRKVARIINDRKRRLEHLQKIAVWQTSVENWQGSELIEESSVLIHSSEVTCRCVKKGSLLWTKELMAFLFDHTLVLCKKDILKRNQLILKDRICLKTAKWEPVTDGKDAFFGISVKNGWKMISEEEDFCYLFMARNKQAKLKWMLAIRDQETLSNSTAAAPPTQQEIRIALAGLRQPNPNNATKVSALRKATSIIPPVNESIPAIHESKSVPAKMWTKNKLILKAQKS